MKQESDAEGRAEIVGDVCTLYLKRRSRPIVCRVLGVIAEGAKEQIYLDRLVHERWHDTFCGLRCSGAISTILERDVARAE